MMPAYASMFTSNVSFLPCSYYKRDKKSYDFLHNKNVVIMSIPGNARVCMCNMHVALCQSLVKKVLQTNGPLC